MDVKQKAESLSDKMNRLTERFTENLDTVDEMLITSDDIIEHVEEKTQDIKLYSNDISSTEIINLQTMVDDFKFVRETLEENTKNGRRVLNAVTLDRLDSDDDKRASLIMSFAELNKAVADNLKLYIQSYKDISNVLLNLEKIKGEGTPDKVENHLHLHGSKKVSTTALIEQLNKKDS